MTTPNVKRAMVGTELSIVLRMFNFIVLICELLELLKEKAALQMERGLGSVEVEQQNLCRFRRADFNARFAIERSSISAGQRLTVDRHFAFSHMNPGMTA